MRRRAVWGWLGALAVAGALLAGCGAPEPGAGEGAGPSTARTYQARGLIESLPDPATGAGELRIRHEAIPDLVGADGEVVGMAAMTMPFPVAAGVDLAGLSRGDAVRFDLAVDWQAARPVEVTAIERLPAGTELTLD